MDRSRIDDKGLDANRKFDIVIQLKDESGNAVSGTYGDMTFTNGSCRLTLKDGDVRRAVGVPTEYSWVVSEPSVPGGYELSGITNSQGSVMADRTVRSVVTNAQQPGWARITKATR